MKFKTNIAIGAVFVALLAFVYFYEIKGGEERRQEAEKSKQLFAFQEDDAQRLELLRGDDALVLDKGTGGWNLSAPMTDGADQEAVERYLRNLLECEREKVVVDSAAASAEKPPNTGLTRRGSRCGCKPRTVPSRWWLLGRTALPTASRTPNYKATIPRSLWCALGASTTSTSALLTCATAGCWPLPKTR